MTRRCSHCSHNGHNSRTCPNRGVKLFGVRLTDGSIRKSASMGNLSLLAGSSGGASPADVVEPNGRRGAGADGYASEDLAQGSSSSCRERKKGTPWTEEEHRKFLLGLNSLGKGDWRGIARNYVGTRTPTQVASHAQKYFIRQTNMTRKKRRSSLFDMVPDESHETQALEPPSFPVSHQESEEQSSTVQLLPPTVAEECESMDCNNVISGEASLIQPAETLQCNYPVLFPAYFPPFMHFPMALWPGYTSESSSEQQAHEIIKPTAVHSKAPIDVDQLVGMSKLSIGDHAGEAPPSSSLSLDLLGGGSNRQSAFHANLPTRAPA